MQLDFSLDALTWNNTAPVLYETARAQPSVADLPPRFDGLTPAPPQPPDRGKPLFVEIAKRRNLRRHELAASGGVYVGDDQVYLIPDDAFPRGVMSKPGDVVIELPAGYPENNEAQPGTRWTVLEVGWGKNRSTRRLTCRDLVLSFDLRDSVTIERPALTFDAAGVSVKRFPSDATDPGGVTLYSDLPARCQLVTKDVAEKYGIRGLEGKYRIIVGREIDVTQEDRLLLPSGEWVDIVGYENAQRIDELPVIIGERKV